MHTLNKASQSTSVSCILEASVTATEEQSRGEAQTESDTIPNTCHVLLFLSLVMDLPSAHMLLTCILNGKGRGVVGEHLF